MRQLRKSACKQQKSPSSVNSNRIYIERHIKKVMRRPHWHRGTPQQTSSPSAGLASEANLSHPMRLDTLHGFSCGTLLCVHWHPYKRAGAEKVTSKGIKRLRNDLALLKTATARLMARRSTSMLTSALSPRTAGWHPGLCARSLAHHTTTSPCTQSRRRASVRPPPWCRTGLARR